MIARRPSAAGRTRRTGREPAKSSGTDNRREYLDGTTGRDNVAHKYFCHIVKLQNNPRMHNAISSPYATDLDKSAAADPARFA
ncbi:hypothetical protein [Rhodoplanes elegans]|uniref:hypothetical protein n=1 Tax=Rhodoplanes elegans TaxID=29408 RepID=UPI0011B94935|nr:hypothetical protein [Rhodoplanes elegans]